MKVLILANNDIGLYKFRKELIDKLCENHVVYMMLPYGEFIEPLKDIGCRYIQFEFNRRGTNPIADISQIKKYVKIIKEIKPDVVLTYTIKPNVYGGIACQITKTPYIANVTGLGTAVENGGLLGFISTSLYKIGLLKAQCVFFQNSENKETFLKKNLVKSKTKLIPGSGVNLAYHKLAPYPDDDNGIRFLFVGRIMRDKGSGEIISAMENIRKEYPQATLDVVGWCDEDYTDILNNAQKRGDVRFHGIQSDVRPFYSQCHCTVLPSYHEGTANVMLESSATGRPVITTRVAGCKETFTEGITGFGCEPKNVESLVAAMRKFMNLSQKQREEMGLSARNKMEKEYDRNMVIEAYQEEMDI